MFGETHPAEREAERLRTIITTLGETCPDMTMYEAKDVIFQIEEKTAKLERQQVEPEIRHIIDLPSDSPEIIRMFSDLQPDSQAEIPLRKINAMKEVRARCTYLGTSIGLKAAKEGVLAWERYGTGSAPAPVYPVTSTPGTAVSSLSLRDQIEWVNGQPTIVDAWDGKTSSMSGKIHAIKECRGLTSLGLKEAKDLVEAWAAKYR